MIEINKDYNDYVNGKFTKKKFKEECSKYGFKPSDYKKHFIVKWGMKWEYEFIGFSSVDDEHPCLCKDMDSCELLNFTKTEIKRRLNRKHGTRKN